MADTNAVAYYEYDPFLGVEYAVPQWSVDEGRARAAGRRIVEEVDAEGVAHFRYDPPLDD